MELTTSHNVLLISAKAVEAFSGEVWVMKKEKGGQLEQTETLDREFPVQELDT